MLTVGHDSGGVGFVRAHTAGVGLISDHIISAPIAGADHPGAGPAAGDFVGGHHEW